MPETTSTQTKIIYRDYGDNLGDLVIACGYRLFVQGVDVSDHVLGSISWTYGGRGTENTCSFTLDNNNNKFVLRPSNLGLSENMSDSSRSFADDESFSTAQPWKITTLKSGAGVQYISSKTAEAQGLTEYSETAKKKLYLNKLNQRVTLETQSGEKYNLHGNTNLQDGSVGTTTTPDISLYEGLFNTQSQVINVMDQVRLYVLDPNHDPINEYESLWIPAFTGFVMSAPPEHDFSTGQSTIAVSCSDIRVLLKRKRVFVNSSSADQITPAISETNGLFKDIVLPNNTTTNAFADASLSFESLLGLALMGIRYTDNAGSLTLKSKLSDYCLPQGASSTLQGDWSNTRTAYQSKSADGSPNPDGKLANVNGFGSLWFGYYYMYDTTLAVDSSNNSNPAREDFMNSWNRLVTFGQNFDYLSWTQMRTQGEQTRPGGDSSALGTLVHFLFPTGGGQVTTLLDRQFIDQMGVQREYMSVGEILEQVCERLDYQYSVTGAGDIVFEFPMYDFRPQDMGEEFKNVYAVSDSVKSHTLNDEANSNPVTCMHVTGGYTDNINSVQAPDQVQGYKYAIFIMHDVLADRYGLNMEEYPIPWLTSGPNQKLTDDDYQRLLGVFGSFEFLKRLTEMSSMTINACYNPFARPNRPYYYNFGRRLAITDTVQNTLSFFSNADTTVDTKYVRRVHDLTGSIIAFGGSMSDGSGDLNGASALPLNYSNKNSVDALFNNDDYQKYLVRLFNSGINILIPDGTGSAGSANTHFATAVSMAPKKAVCAWSYADKAAFDKLCASNNIPPANMLCVMLTESSLNAASLNKTPQPVTRADGTPYRLPDGSQAMSPTYAMGLFGMLPVNIATTLKNHPELNPNAGAADGSNLASSQYIKAKKSGKGFYTPNNLSGSEYSGDVSNKAQFATQFQQQFSTPASQIAVYNAWLGDFKSTLPPGSQVGSLDTLAAIQQKTTAATVKTAMSNPSALPDYIQNYKTTIANNTNLATQVYPVMANGCAPDSGNAAPAATPAQPNPKTFSGFLALAQNNPFYGISGTGNDEANAAQQDQRNAAIVTAAGTGIIVPTILGMQPTSAAAMQAQAFGTNAPPTTTTTLPPVQPTIPVPQQLAQFTNTVVPGYGVGNKTVDQVNTTGLVHQP